MPPELKFSEVRFGKFTGRINDVDLRLLRVFRTIVDCGGLTTAQVELGIGRSTISKHLSDLEQRIGLRLCERGRAGFYVNDHGLEVYRATQQLLASLEDFHSRISDLHRDQVGSVSVGVVESTVTDEMSPLIRAIKCYKGLAPGVTITLLVAPPSEIECAVLDGTCHLGIVPRIHGHSSLRFQPLYVEEVALYCSCQHHLFKVPDEEIDCEDLVDQDVVWSLTATPPRARKMLAKSNSTAVTESTEGNAILILSGKYLGFLPIHFAEAWVRTGRMRQLLPKQTLHQSNCDVITRRGVSLPRLASRFLHVLMSTETAIERQQLRSPSQE